jgi:hypothetical protein
LNWCIGSSKMVQYFISAFLLLYQKVYLVIVHDSKHTTDRDFGSRIGWVTHERGGATTTGNIVIERDREISSIIISDRVLS